MSTVSFADQMPNLLHSKDIQSEYSYFDVTKLKLFAGPHIWKYRNLLNPSVTTHNKNVSTIQQQQQHQASSSIRQRIHPDGTSVINAMLGPKRHVRVDLGHSMSIEQIMFGMMNTREKKAVGISQSALVLRMREKNLNQMQLARKLRPLTDLTNSHNFPQLNFEHLSLNNRRTTRQEQTAEQHDDFDDDEFHHDVLNDNNEGTIEFVVLLTDIVSYVCHAIELVIVFVVDLTSKK
jgi:hypothetical protein